MVDLFRCVVVFGVSNVSPLWLFLIIIMIINRVELTLSNIFNKKSTIEKIFNRIKHFHHQPGTHQFVSDLDLNILQQIFFVFFLCGLNG